jgi:hypothetical protein
LCFMFLLLSPPPTPPPPPHSPLFVGNTNGLSLFLDAHALASITENPEAKANFDSQMTKIPTSLATMFFRHFGDANDLGTLDPFQFPECDASADPNDSDPSDLVNAVIFGRWELY